MSILLQKKTVLNKKYILFYFIFILFVFGLIWVYVFLKIFLTLKFGGGNCYKSAIINQSIALEKYIYVPNFPKNIVYNVS